jgi:hypothetical protein
VQSFALHYVKNRRKLLPALICRDYLFATDKGWFIFNAVDGVMTIVPCKPSANSRIEIVVTQNNWQDIPSVLNNVLQTAVRTRINNSFLSESQPVADSD